MNHPIILKFLIIGDKKTGRSTLLEKSLNLFRFSADHKGTIGVEPYTKSVNIEGREGRLIIFNISNEKRFRHLLPSFISGTCGALLMFDITHLKSFNFLSDFPHIIREHAGDVPILLVGNKIDLEKEREVSGEEGMSFAKDNKLIGYIEISTKASQECEKIIDTLAKTIITKLEGEEKANWEIWNSYISSLEQKMDKISIEASKMPCQSCKHFIKTVGGLFVDHIGLCDKDGKKITEWIHCEEWDVSRCRSIFREFEKKYDTNSQLTLIDNENSIIL